MVFSTIKMRPIAVDMAPAELYLSGLGMTGYTAYFGMMDIGRPQPDETVVVSAAAGAVGSIAAQLAKNAECARHWHCRWREKMPLFD